MMRLPGARPLSPGSKSLNRPCPNFDPSTTLQSTYHGGGSRRGARGHDGTRPASPARPCRPTPVQRMSDSATPRCLTGIPLMRGPAKAEDNTPVSVQYSIQCLRFTICPPYRSLLPVGCNITMHGHRPSSLQ
jgi:hypothetical protein